MGERLNRLIEKKRSSAEKLLSIFLTAGYPRLDDTVEIILDLDAAGVDFIELGMPFSDPIADGPVIQETSQQALDNGITLSHIFEIVRKAREHVEIPIILMGYLNPIHRMGIESFMERASESGADGLIIPDWPLEESRSYGSGLSQNGLDLIHLIAPNTPPARIEAIDEATTSFIYCVAYTGVTGGTDRPKALDFFERLRNLISHPLMIGFGVRNQADFLEYTRFADGVIVGSAFMKLLKSVERTNRPQEIEKFIRAIRR